ncbi:MAG: tRNA glutamyl-Q(34) synthetase GluQRS [Luminiphilus sp.]|nr:tRNA glutamyl-Q(34) synthetase GluQRS [Luminiphilus sp.]MBL6897859.1 tRNA glutamyl-Q(34) synthetase GluQRS [Luminiphilus sp.]MBT6351706.1 tRNA glutamyl-Q(34) synthetase GluQRS [Halieaceae bacterium]
MSSTSYRGRFAPSPTGPLHLGSMVAAVASFLDARQNRGAWHLRIDDIDPPRQINGSVEGILSTLIQHGLQWDGPVAYQSHSAPAYEQALQQLEDDGWLFRCLCTRTHLNALGACGQNCQEISIDREAPHSLRVRVKVGDMCGFEDGFLGFQPVVENDIPVDFIVRRRDGLFAYQLAAAIDDAIPRHTHVVRGADLLKSTHRQRWLHHILGLTSPHYSHVPVIYDENGNKLSKQTGAKAVSASIPANTLRRCLQHLSQSAPPPSAVTTSEILDHALDCWTGTRSTLPVT